MTELITVRRWQADLWLPACRKAKHGRTRNYDHSGSIEEFLRDAETAFSTYGYQYPECYTL